MINATGLHAVQVALFALDGVGQVSFYVIRNPDDFAASIVIEVRLSDGRTAREKFHEDGTPDAAILRLTATIKVLTGKPA